VSPFLDDSLEETTANILKCDFCFPDEYFADISNEGKDLISSLLVATSSQRMTAQECLDSPWFKDVRHCHTQFMFYEKDAFLKRHLLNKMNFQLI
jgi:serine/threonine protein kinase